MSTNGKHPPPISPARRMARAKLRSMRRAKRADAPEPASIESRPSTPARSTPDTYAVERAAYARRKPDLLREAPGKYVVFVGEAMIGPFDDQRSALSAAYRTFGYRPIYTKRIQAEEPVVEIGTIDVTCRS